VARAGVTTKVLEAVAAAATVELPDWLAVTVQVPAASNDRVVPLTLQTAGVVEANVTVNPAEDVATKVGGATPMVWSGTAAKVMVCAVGTKTLAAAIAKLLVTTVAAAKLALPAWVAVRVQVPADISVSAVPVTVQTDGVVDASVTGKPEVEVAASWSGAVPIVWLPGFANVMVCAVSATGVAPKAR